jgi:hypothetical protein
MSPWMTANCLSPLDVEDAHWFEQAKEGGHPAKRGHPRPRLVKKAPLVEQADTIAPAFDLLSAPETPAHKACKRRVGEIAVTQPDFERPPNIKDQLCTWEMVAQRAHQRLDLRFCKVDENGFGQEQKGARR